MAKIETGAELDQKQLLEVLVAFKKGDFSARMPKNLTGIEGKIADALNDAIENNQKMAKAIEKVSKNVGRDGKISQRFGTDGWSGSWGDNIESLNSLLDDLVLPTVEITRVISAVVKGDLTQAVAVETNGKKLEGEFLKSAKIVNSMVEQLNFFSQEVTRVAREVGVEGKLGGQAQAKGLFGSWKDLTDSVNSMASNLTAQVRNIAEVTIAVASGDLSRKITVDVRGEFLQLKDTINTMVEQLRSFASEVTRVAKEVGTEGKLGGQAVVPGVGGVWKELTDNVNSMGSNLTSQVRNIAAVTTAVAKGDLTRKITVDVSGEMQELKLTINTMVDQLNAFASEVTRVAREVGTEGILGGQGSVPGVAGTWKDLTDSVNFMASNLTSQVRNIAEVTTAVAGGDLSKKITVDAKGEIFELKNTMNTMVDQLNAFAGEVTRVAKEVGTDGKLGGQAVVKGVSGTWKDLTDNVNSMASNLTSQVRNIAQVTTAVANGDLAKKITVDAQGEILELKNTVNAMVDRLNSFANEVTRIAREVGADGLLGGQADVKDVSGTWKNLTDSVNMLAGNLTSQVRNIALVTTAVANGDLTRKITVDASGEILELKDTINIMVDQLSSFASEVTRVAREVGTEGKLGGQGEVKGVSGTWKDLTDNVNSMASNLTSQVRNIAQVTTAVATGDLTKKITVDAQGEILELKDTINTMVDQLSAFSSEVTRVAREVGTDGRLGGQGEVKGVSGVWKDLTDNVNSMAANLTSQVRNIAQVTTAVANGDLTRKITVDAQGEILDLKSTINVMVDQLSSFASEVTRVAREVGAEGILGGQGSVPGVAGTWKDLTDSVNMLAGNLTNQVRNIALVTTAVANGDLSKKITVDANGEILELKSTINTMVDQLSSFASEVTRVAREVGTDGKLGGQAEVKDVSGTWKDLTDNVNLMAANLTNQVRNIADVTTAVAKGDLARKITVDAKGEILELKNTVNIMVDQLSSFASEVTRVAREVGFDGKLGGQAEVKGVSGTWKDLTDSVNMLAGNLTSQVRNIAQVTTAVANGDLNKKITVDAKGEIFELKNTINIMVDQLSSFASEVTRVAKEVGTEGKLGGQGEVKGVTGTWKDLTDNVNSMAANLTSQVRNIAQVTTAVANGDLSKKITVDARGEILELKNTINIMVDQLNSFAGEVTRVSREVGTDGKLGGQALVKGVAGTWKDLTDNVNFMATNLTDQVRNIAVVTTAVANGDLTRKITVDARGEILELKDTINSMVDQLNSFASEVTRVAREVGTEGKLGGQAQVRGVAGTWKDLTDNVNLMASNLTDQVRGIAKVVTSVANGDLRQKLTVPAKGEIAQLSDTINNMIDTLDTFSEQVIGVAKEVGVEGRLGGQANVPGAAGTWKALTDNVNQLAANLTTQIRAIAEIATSVTKGDLSRTILVAAKGEVEELRLNLNEMIRNLSETTGRNTEQDWLKTNLAKFTRMLQGQRDMNAVAQQLLSELSPLVGANHGVFYSMGIDATEETEVAAKDRRLKLLSSYAYKERKNVSSSFKMGEGLVGQAAFEKQRILVTNVPHDYVQITSGLGEATPLNIIDLPVLFEGQVKAVIELASFNLFSPIHQMFLDQLMDSLGIVLNTIEANTRTEGLLQKSQALAEELQSQQEELQQTNEELEEKAKMLSEQKIEVENKNREVEQARGALEEKAEQLALTSKYKSEFLSNMSHELRTPLNSLLILSKQLADNPEKHLADKEVDYANTIHSSGNDLLNLINDILDLSKIESGTVSVDLGDVSLLEIKSQINRTFSHMADAKGLGFDVDISPNSPHSIQTDEKRLQQVMKNLLSNAFKFTEKGSVNVKIAPALSGWSYDHASLNRSRQVISFSVTDTGIGIPVEKQKIIFEAFQQADGSTSRKYGGTGLGLSISREIAALLGGELKVTSKQGEGSTFTLYLPLNYLPSKKKQSDDPVVPSTSRKFSSEEDRTDDETPFEKAEVKSPLNRKEKPTAKIAFNDDRNLIEPGDKIILIAEDDLKFAEILFGVAHDNNFKAIVSPNGNDVLDLVHKYKPDAITLDLNFPDLDGWTILDRLKLDPDTRHIPVQIISVEEEKMRGLHRGAVGYFTKPVNKESLEKAFAHIADYIQRPKKLLVVDDDAADREDIVKLIGNGDVKITLAENGEQALELLRKEKFDCMVLDLILPIVSGMEVLEEMQKDKELSELPVIVFTGKDLTKKEEAFLKKISSSVLLKDVRDPERLVDETALFLHRVISKLPEEKRKMIERFYEEDTSLRGKKILIVDDDMRNIFALTSLLEQHGVVVLTAENGKDAIQLIKNTADVDAVLMDIMMPVMDGYETTKIIRKNDKFKKLPIIALTAKAMKGDREKCIEAGASDYITKPVNTDQLLSLLRVWMYK
ncbi:MAG: HAMP domain-containing protein [Ignavibacteriaceae bacterium]|nr:HAMP domain-containing protein [Ignavibacteriaceae bacterium]